MAHANATAGHINGRRAKLGSLLALIVLAALVTVAQEHAGREPLTFTLDCSGGDCPLLKGAPQTGGMRGGSVKLKPGESVGAHSTNGNEEALVVLRGSGTVTVEGHADVQLHQDMLAYIPTATRHNVTNSGKETLEYVWIVAPIKP